MWLTVLQNFHLYMGFEIVQLKFLICSSINQVLVVKISWLNEFCILVFLNYINDIL